MVDLPTATLPATAMMNGASHVLPEERADRLAQPGARLEIKPQQPAQRQVDVLDLAELDRVGEPADLIQLPRR